MSKSSLEAAAEAAARVNAMLIAKGKLKLPANQLKPKAGLNSSGRGAGDLITAEFEINDAPLSARNLLTRGHTQDEICKYSGAAISTRGRYMTLEERQKSTSSDRPLYLHIQASTQAAVDVAIAHINELISQHSRGQGGTVKPPVTVITYSTITNAIAQPPVMTVASAPLSSGPHFVQDKVFIGLEHAPATYPVREKVLGPGGSYLQHIRTETGATVTLRGKGSGYIEPTSGREAFEPLYIHLTHPKLEGLNAAKALALNLVETVHAEFSQWQQQQQQQQQQQIVSIALQPATHVGFQTPSLVQRIVPAVSSSAVPSPNVALSAAPGTAIGLPVASSVPALVQTSISLPTYTVVSSVAPMSSVLNTSNGVVQGRSLSAITYPTTFITSQAAPLGQVATQAAPVAPPSTALVPTSIYAPAIAASQPALVQAPVSVASVALVTPQTVPILAHAAQTPAPASYASLSQADVAPAQPASVAHSVLALPNSSGQYSYASVPVIATQAVQTLPPPQQQQQQPLEMNSLQAVTTAYPHLQAQYTRPPVAPAQQQPQPYTRPPPPPTHQQMQAQKRRFTEDPDELNHTAMQRIPCSLQDSISQQSLDVKQQQQQQQQHHQHLHQHQQLQQQQQHQQQQQGFGVAPREKNVKDSDLMPPPPLPSLKDLQADKASRRSESYEPDKKRLRGALGGLAAVYGSDDSDEESPVGSPTTMKRPSSDPGGKFSKSFGNHVPTSHYA